MLPVPPAHEAHSTHSTHSAGESDGLVYSAGVRRRACHLQHTLHSTQIESTAIEEGKPGGELSLPLSRRNLC